MANRQPQPSQANGQDFAGVTAASGQADPRFIAMVADLARAEQSCPFDRVHLQLGPYTAFVMVGALQLAWRHPAHNPKLRGLIERLARSIQAGFSDEYQQLLETGWDESQDVRGDT